MERQCPRHNACRTNPIFRDTHLSLHSNGEKKRETKMRAGNLERERESANRGHEEIEDG